MDLRRLLTAAAATLAVSGVAQAQRRFNPVVELLSQNKPVFGVYIPANRRAGRGGPALPPDSVKSQAQLAKDALAYTAADFLFDGSMEGAFDAAMPMVGEFAAGLFAAGGVSKAPYPRLIHPMFVKTPGIAPNPALARERIGKQLGLGVANITFVDVESAQEVKDGLAMMRFKSAGGTRSDDVGDAPARWGMSEKEYKEKADLAGLSKKGELVNFTIVESKEGLAHIREIAAVKGIGVLFPGAGTLRGVFTSPPDANGNRVFDAAGWEAAIQQVLAACKEFKVPCGYPATAADIEMRMKQGFSVFIINWGEAGFKTIDMGRKAAGR